MPSENDGVMIVLSSPSGAGKTTLVKMLSKMDNYKVSISHTTRRPRPNEINNKDYTEKSSRTMSYIHTKIDNKLAAEKYLNFFNNINT